MNLKRELVKTGNYFFQLCLHLWERDLDAFSSKLFSSIILIGIGFLGFCFEPKNDGSRKKSKQNTKKNNYCDENVTFP
jgi:hypothetical protein